MKKRFDVLINFKILLTTALAALRRKISRSVPVPGKLPGVNYWFGLGQYQSGLRNRQVHTMYDNLSAHRQKYFTENLYFFRSVSSSASFDFQFPFPR
jgi:hypothetical protein